MFVPMMFLDGMKTFQQARLTVLQNQSILTIHMISLQNRELLSNNTHDVFVVRLEVLKIYHIDFVLYNEVKNDL